MSRILWVGALNAAAAQTIQIKEAFKHYGYEVTSVLPKTAVSAQWILDQVPAMTSGFVLSLPAKGSPEWVRDFVTMLRCSPTDKKFLSVFVLAPELTTELAELVRDCAVDDVFTEATSHPEIFCRISMRLRDAETRRIKAVELQEQVARDAKNETVLKQREEFLSVCAHDLRSPLGLIQAGISMVMGDPQIQERLSALQLELLSRSKRQAGHAITLVNDLLDVMSYEQGLKPQYQFLRLDEILSEFHRDYSLQAGQKGITFHYENQVKEWRVLLDPDRIRQLLINLFSNAIKFTEKGKNIYLSVQPFLGRRRHDPPFPMLVVSLRDEGKGIPKAELEKIFDRFSQVKGYGRAEGRGLGLTVAKQISNLHDGNLWVESELGKGSTFSFLFPHVVSRPSQVEIAHRQILVAEPSVKRRQTHFDSLKSWGFEVCYTSDGIETVTQLFHRLPDVVILSSGLTKFPELEIASIMKGDPASTHKTLIYASESGTLPKSLQGRLFDGVIKLPFTKADFEALLTSINSPTKKAA